MFAQTGESCGLQDVSAHRISSLTPKLQNRCQQCRAQDRRCSRLGHTLEVVQVCRRSKWEEVDCIIKLECRCPIYQSFSLPACFSVTQQTIQFTSVLECCAFCDHAETWQVSRSSMGQHIQYAVMDCICTSSWAPAAFHFPPALSRRPP
jgi:hypothetical protein